MSQAEPPLHHQRGHHGLFYETREFLVDRVAAFVGDGLAAGEHVLALATLSHWDAITARLDDRGINYERATSEGRLVLIDADLVLDSITVGHGVSVDAFRAMLESLVPAGVRVRIYGDLAWLLVARGDIDSAVTIEALGKEFGRHPDVLILCGYDAAGGQGMSPEDVRRIEATHQHSVFEGTASPLPARTCHAVRFYESADELAGLAGRFIGEGLAAGMPAIIVATPEHRAAIDHVLTMHYVDVRRAEASGHLIIADAEQTLAQFMVDGVLDPVRFRQVVIPLLDRASRGGNNVLYAYGEMVGLLWRAGQVDAAVQLETLWNELAQTHSLARLCAYAMDSVPKGTAFDDICGLHTHVV